MGMSKTLYFSPIKTQLTLKLQMQYYRISYFSSLKLAPQGECVVKALFLNKIVPAGCFYFVHLVLSSQDLQPSLLSLYSSVIFPKSEKLWEKKKILMGQKTPLWHPKRYLQVQTPHRVKLRTVIQYWVMEPLEMTF